MILSKKLSSILYSLTRLIGKTASKVADVETLSTLDIEKIAKRAARKQVYKTGNKITKNISKKIK